MPTIKFPDDISVSLPGPQHGQDVAAVVTFERDFVVRMLLADAAWGKDMDSLYSCMAIRGAFEKGRDARKAEIGPDHHAKLLEVMRHPTAPYNPIVAVQLLPFFEALKSAEAP